MRIGKINSGDNYLIGDNQILELIWEDQFWGNYLIGEKSDYELSQGN